MGDESLWTSAMIIMIFIITLILITSIIRLAWSSWLLADGHLVFDREVIRLRRVTKDGSCWLLGGTPLIIRITTIPWKITNGFYLQTFGKARVEGDGVVVSLVYLVLNWWCLVYLVYLVYLVINWWCYHSGHSMNYDEDTSTEFVLEAWCPPAVYRCWSKRIMMLSVI